VINFSDPVLAAINSDDTHPMTRLHDQLVVAAEAEQLLDIAYWTMHRVLCSDGTLGDYIGGPEAKAALLSLESGRPIDRDTLPG
jgi:hypothetical protein